MTAERDPLSSAAAHHALVASSLISRTFFLAALPACPSSSLSPSSSSKQEQLNQAEDVLVGGKEAVRVVGRLEDVTDDVEYNKDVISFDKKIQKKKKGKGAATEKAVQEHTALVKDDGKNEDRVEDFEMSESDEDVDDAVTGDLISHHRQANTHIYIM